MKGKWVTRKRKGIPRTRDGSLKCIIDEYGVERFYCIICKEYKLREEMGKAKTGGRAYNLRSYCLECDKKRNKKKSKKNYDKENNTWGSKIKEGRIIGMRTHYRLRFPRWIKGEGYAEGYYLQGEKI